jgi:hypothetical protein
LESSQTIRDVLLLTGQEELQNDIEIVDAFIARGIKWTL